MTSNVCDVLLGEPLAEQALRDPSLEAKWRKLMATKDGPERRFFISDHDVRYAFSEMRQKKMKERGINAINWGTYVGLVLSARFPVEKMLTLSFSGNRMRTLAALYLSSMPNEDPSLSPVHFLLNVSRLRSAEKCIAISLQGEEMKSVYLSKTTWEDLKITSLFSGRIQT